MVHYGQMSSGAGGIVDGLPVAGLMDQPEPLMYIRSMDAVDTSTLDQQQQQQQQLSKSRNTFYCEQCNIVFGSKSAHTSHMKSHSKYVADTTAASAVNNTVTPAELEGNLNGASPAPAAVTQNAGGGGGDPYQCDKCNKTFAVPARLVSNEN